MTGFPTLGCELSIASRMPDVNQNEKSVLKGALTKLDPHWYSYLSLQIAS